MIGLSRSTVVILSTVVLLCLAGVGSVVGLTHFQSGTTSEIVSAENTTNYVIPARDNVTRQEYEQANLDVATVIAADTERIQAQHDRMVFEEIVASREDEVAKQEIADRIEQRIATLERRQERLFNEYSSGEMTGGTLLRELTRIEVGAQNQNANIERYFDGDSAEFSVGLDVQTSMFENPVSQQIVGAQNGNEGPVNVYVLSAPDSMVAATVIEDTFYRQATLRSERNPSGTDQLAESEQSRAQAASDRAEELYSTTPDTVRGFTGTNLYQFRKNHSHGTLVGYLDGATQNPVHEYQYKQPIVDVPARTISNTGENFRLNVQYTDATGPMAISLLGTNGDVSPSVDIAVDGNSVGSIEGSGQLWTVQPTGAFTVTASTEDGEIVSVAVPKR